MARMVTGLVPRGPHHMHHALARPFTCFSTTTMSFPGSSSYLPYESFNSELCKPEMEADAAKWTNTGTISSQKDILNFVLSEMKYVLLVLLSRSLQITQNQWT